MGIAQVPAGSSGLSSVVRSIQRGVAVSSGNITITSVDTTKTIVNSFSTTSSGTVAASGVVNAATGSTSATSTSGFSGNWTDTFAGAPAYYTQPHGSSYYNPNPRYGPQGPYPSPTTSRPGSFNGQNINAANISLNAQNITGGTTNLVAGVNGAYLTNATTLTVTGPCRYEVVEYY